MAKWLRRAIAAALITVFAVVNMARYGQVQPRMMGDELVYSQNVLLRTMGEITHPNYLYKLVFQPVALCGDNFYLCTKWLNTGFLVLLAVLVYLIAMHVGARRRYALVISSLIGLGPVSSYSSYFTPDIMFLALCSAVIWAYVRKPFAQPWANWALVGGMLSMALLTKPHALVLVAALVVAEAWGAWRGGWGELSRRASVAAAVGLAAVGVRIALGFALAGANGLNLLGGQYQDALSMTSAASSDQAGGGDGGGISGVARPTRDWFDIATDSGLTHFALQLVLNIGVLLLLLAPLLLLAFRAAGQSRVSDLARLVIASLGFGILVSSMFVALASGWGENLGGRTMVRYYEYAVWLLPIFAAVSLERAPDSTGRSRWTPLALALAVIPPVWLAIAETPPLGTDFSLYGAIGGLGLFWLIVIAVGSLAIFALLAFEVRPAKRVWAMSLAPALFVLGWVGTNQVVIQPGLSSNPYIESAAWVRNNFDVTSYREVVAVGNDYRLLQTTSFWMRLDGLRLFTREFDDVVSLKDVPKNSLVILIDRVTTDDNVNVIYESEYFSVVEKVKNPQKR